MDLVYPCAEKNMFRQVFMINQETLRCPRTYCVPEDIHDHLTMSANTKLESTVAHWWKQVSSLFTYAQNASNASSGVK